MLLGQLGKHGQAIHHRHVDIGEHEFDLGIGRDETQGFGAVAGELERELAGSDLPPEALADQQLEIGFVVNDEKILSPSRSRRIRREGHNSSFQVIEVDRLAEKIRGAELVGDAAAFVIAVSRDHHNRHTGPKPLDLA